MKMQRRGKQELQSGLTENEVGLLDALVHLGGEEEVLADAGLDDLVEPGFVDWEVRAVPRLDPRLRNVNDGDLDFWALERNHRHRLCRVKGALAIDWVDKKECTDQSAARTGPPT